MYKDEEAWANSVVPDQTPRNASDQGPHCLPFSQVVFRHTIRYWNIGVQILRQYGK